MPAALIKELKTNFKSTKMNVDNLKDTHKIDGVAKKWLMLNKFKPTRKDEPAGYSTAHMHEIGPEDGLMFATVARCDMHSGEGNGRKASCQEVPS